MFSVGRVRLVAVVGGVVITSCWPGAPTHVDTSPRITMSEAACGPVDESTPATLPALRQAFAGLEVEPLSVGYRVSRGGKRLLIVIPDDRGRVCNVYATSPAIAVDSKPWRAHKPFAGAETLTNCGCWRDHLACWTRGEHVAVTFGYVCDFINGNDPSQRRALDGRTVSSIVWRAMPYGDELDLGRCLFLEGEDD